jgi:hypothetical protein
MILTFSLPSFIWCHVLKKNLCVNPLNVDDPADLPNLPDDVATLPPSQYNLQIPDHIKSISKKFAKFYLANLVFCQLLKRYVK